LTIPLALLSGIPSSIASSRKSRETGMAKHWILTRRSSTMPAPLKPKPGFASLLISTAGIILVVSNRHRIKLLPFAYNATKLCPSGITPLGLNCRIILAWSLRSPNGDASRITECGTVRRTLPGIHQDCSGCSDESPQILFAHDRFGNGRRRSGSRYAVSSLSKDQYVRRQPPTQTVVVPHCS